jgi:hypothetical protein
LHQALAEKIEISKLFPFCICNPPPRESVIAVMSSSQSSLEEGQIPAIGQADPPDSEGEQQWLPDIIIAIDLGLTYTGTCAV